MSGSLPPIPVTPPAPDGGGPTEEVIIYSSDGIPTGPVVCFEEAPPPPLPVPNLQAMLVDAQTQYHLLLTGAKPAVVTYGQGDGTKSVQYTRANIGMLAAYIASLQKQLGYRARRPIRLAFTA